MNEQEIVNLVWTILAEEFPNKSIGADVEVNGLDDYDHWCRADIPRVCIEFVPDATVTPQEMEYAFDVSPLDHTVGWCITTVDRTGIYVVHP